MKVVTPKISRPLRKKLREEAHGTRPNRRWKAGLRRRSFDRYIGARISVALRQLGKTTGVVAMLSTSASLAQTTSSLGKLRGDVNDLRGEKEGEILFEKVLTAFGSVSKLLNAVTDELDRLCCQQPGTLAQQHEAASAAVASCLGEGLSRGLATEEALTLAQLTLGLGAVRDPNFELDITLGSLLAPVAEDYSI